MEGWKIWYDKTRWGNERYDMIKRDWGMKDMIKQDGGMKDMIKQDGGMKDMIW